MYNLNDSQVREFQRRLLNYYDTEGGIVRAEIKPLDAIEIIDSITEESIDDMRVKDVMELIKFSHRDLIRNGRLAENNGYYKTIRA